MKTMIRNSIGLIAVLWLGCTAVWGKGISVDLNASDIEVGQQVRLTLTYDPKEAQGVPDLSTLQTDFTIVGTEQAMSYTVVNGQARSIGHWGIVLEPKHSGMITIPAFRIGALTSVPVQLNVSPRTQAAPVQTPDTPQQAAANLQEEVALTVGVDNKSPYLNQEILYKVSLMTRHQLVDVRYQAPQVEDAILFPIGEGKQYQTIRKGVSYQVDEQIYAIFPQKSGPIRITPPTLHALRYASTPQPVALQGDSVTLDVQPLPKHFVRREWLPSKLVRLRETYDQSATQLVEGATLVRTIELQAQGLVAQLLPQIPLPESADLRTYPEQAEQDNRIQQGELWGRTKLKVTYVFPRPGKVVLPAIRVPWFNVKTQKLAIAELPAKSYDIRSSSPIKKSKSSKPKLQKTSITPQAIPVVRAASWEVKPIFLLWAGAVATILGLLFGAWHWQMRTVRPSRSLRAACMANNVERTKLALVAWGRLRWPNKEMSHFTDILPLLPKQEPLYIALQAFIAAVYHPEHSSNWDGASLWQAIVAYKKHHTPKKTRRARTSAMPPIYPTRK
jgi:hypothetical protein